MPKVSVIIPNYNHAPYLSQRIDSVLNQTYQDFEVIILDDKSTDNSKEIIEQYKEHPKISHIVYNEVNSGSTFKQWEKGIELARGEWIWIAESDDWAENDFLNIIMSDLLSNHSLSIVYCQSYTYLPKGKILIRAQREPQKKVIKGEEFFNNYLVTGNSIYNASMAVFNKAHYTRISSSEYKNYRYCGDWIFWAELSKQGDVVRYTNLLNHFRKTGEIDVSSKVVSFGINYIEEVKALKYFRDTLNCNSSTYMRQLKKYYFEYKHNHKLFSLEINKEILKNFEKILGGKKLLVWNLKYIKHQIAFNFYKSFKENI